MIKEYLELNYGLVLKDGKIVLDSTRYIEVRFDNDMIYMIYRGNGEGHSRFGKGTEFIDDEMKLIGINKEVNLFNV